ncbi:MAG TPA: glycoside hydrolase family 36 protein [Steroidobacteraceae bacterium]|jgi:alpha-galactosidase|nr:glycoside hydrolase family 36 protein [Steroidobacteraceae bacterium]
MNFKKTSRREFVQLTGGLALCLRHGLLPAQPSSSAARAAAALDDSSIRIEWDANLQARVSRLTAGSLTPMTAWRPTDYLLRADGRHIAAFTLQHQARDSVEGVNGPGARLTLCGVSAEGIEKTVAATLYQRYPGFAVYRVSYRNASAAAVTLRGWTNGDFLVRGARAGSSTVAPEFWCYSGASYEDRRDWVQPVKHGFAQDNFLGMEASDYGGGTPIIDVWRRDGGLAVGHVETTPKLVSLPVEGQHGNVRVAVCSREKLELRAGDSFQTPETFVAVHGGDHFAALSTYRRIISERGLAPAEPRAACYEPIWCAWGYERDCTTALIEGTLPKVKDLGLAWAVIDDGWQSSIGDWRPHPKKYPNGEDDLRGLVSNIRAAGLKPRLWYSPLSVAPGTDLLHDHADMLLLDKNGAVQNISWWNSFYLCPAYEKTVRHTEALVRKFIGEWGFAGLKIDGQHLNGVPPCFNPAHRHARPEDSVEGLQNFFRAIYRTAIEINPDAVLELCPCGTAYSAFNFAYMNQAPASDPESSWQVRHKGKTLKALMGPSAAYAGDHVELSDNHDDFASTVGVGGIISTKFTWPIDPKPKDSFLLAPEKEPTWRHWIALYREKMLPLGTYRGELYDIGFDKPEAHAIEKSGRMYYAFFAERWNGEVALRGLQPGAYRVRDYFNDRDLGTVAAQHRLPVTFERFLLLEAIPA